MPTMPELAVDENRSPALALDVRCNHCDQPHRIELEECRCCLCGSDQSELLYTRSDLALGLPGEFKVVRCSSCQLIYLNPRPTVDSIGYYYPPSYEAYSLVEVDELKGWSRWLGTMHLNKRCNVVAKRKKGGRLLDVGCSNGRFLHHMRHFGEWERYGSELIPEVAEDGRSRYGLNIFTGTLEDASFDDHYFDAVTLWDVLEHVYNPAETLVEVSRILTDDGLLAFSIPILDSLGGRVFGQYWVGYEVPRHLHIFTRETLDQMLEKAGLTKVDEMALYGSNYAFADSVRFTLRGRGWPQPVYGGMHWLLRHKLWRWPTAPFFKVLDLLNMTSIVTVVCKPSRSF